MRERKRFMKKDGVILKKWLIVLFKTSKKEIGAR